MDISSTIQADSTQINADDLVSPRTVTITGVSKGTADQPVNLEVAEFPGRAYRPCKSMRRVLVFAWGPDASTYIGRRLTLFNDQTVKWGGVAVGGLRIAAMSNIDKPLTIALTETRGKKKPHKVEPLPDAPPPSRQITAASIIGAFDALGVTVEQLEARSESSTTSGPPTTSPRSPSWARQSRTGRPPSPRSSHKARRQGRPHDPDQG